MTLPRQTPDSERAELGTQTRPLFWGARYRSSVAGCADASPRVTVCGTFNRGGLAFIADAVVRFMDAGARVMSPVDPRPTLNVNGFWYVASDLYRDELLVERRHLDACAASDFVWLVAPDGYVGMSAAIEAAFAAGRGVPVYTADDVREPAVAALTTRVSSTADVLSRALGQPRGQSSVLLDPDEATRRVIDAVESLRALLTSRSCDADIAAQYARAAQRGLGSWAFRA